MSFRQILSTPGVKEVLFTQLLASIGFGIILPILPFYVTSLGAKPFELGILTATFAFVSLVFSPFLGKISDKAGRKKVILFGTFGFVFSYLIFAFASSLEMVFAARALEGLFAAALFPACVSLISDLTTDRQRGKAMGLFSMVFSLGFILGPALGGIASAISVRDAFFLASGLSLLNFAWIFFKLKEPKEKDESKNLVQKETKLLSHLSSPLLFVFLSTFMITFMIGGLDAVLALYTGEKMDFTSAQVGLLFAYIGVLIMVMQFVSGALVNRFGETRLINAGLVFSAAGFVMLVFTHDWISLLLPLAVFVMGNALVFPSASSLLTKRITGNRGAVIGLNGSFASSGQMIGPLLGGFLYGFNHDYAFLGLATVVFAYALFFFLFAGKNLSEPEPTESAG